MCRLFETIRVVDGEPRHLPYHEARMTAARRALLSLTGAVRLSPILSVPNDLRQGTVRCRVVYGRSIESVEFTPYTRRSVTSLALVHDETIDYGHKYLDRSALERLRESRGDADDVLIVRRGLVTDTSFSNIAFDDGTGWVTPAEPLLAGTARARLIAAGTLREATITPADLVRFRRAALVNAMLDPGDCLIDMGRIR